MATSGQIKHYFSLNDVINGTTAARDAELIIDWVQEKYNGTSYNYSKVKVKKITLKVLKTINYPNARYTFNQIRFQLKYEHSYKTSSTASAKSERITYSFTANTDDVNGFAVGTYDITSLGDEYIGTSFRANYDGTYSSVPQAVHNSSSATKPVIFSYKTGSVGTEAVGAYLYSDSVANLEIDHVLFPSILTAPDSAYIGDKITLYRNLQQSGADYKHTFTYSVGSLSGVIAEKTTLDSVQWNIPMEIITQIGTDSTHITGTLTLTTYHSNGSIIGQTTKEIILRMDVNESAPTFNPTAKDTNATTLALTGNENIFIRYYSNVYITVGAVAKDGATIATQGANAAGKTFTGASGTIKAIETGDIDIHATDSRGFTSFGKINKTLIPYDKLSCNLYGYNTTTDGNLNFIIEGNYYNGSFGAVNNKLTIEYRYKVEQGAYSNWIPVTFTPTSHSYYVDLTLQGLDYQKLYTIQARVADKLSSAISEEKQFVGLPIFDWSRFDFNFNVDIASQGNVSVANDKGIYGKTANDTEVLALSPCDSANNLTLGYGGYSEEVGSTKIYGNEINVLANGDFTFNDISIKGLINAITNSYTFTTTTTKGANYSSASCALTLRGNCLYCRVYGSRSSVSGTGDFTDEIIGTVSFNHGGKITGMDYVSGVTGSSGPTAAIAMSNIIVNNNTASFDVSLTNSAAAGRNFMASFVIPVSLNLNAFV